METMELNLNEMEGINGGWDWKKSLIYGIGCGLAGAGVGGHLGGVPGAVAGAVIGAGVGVLMGAKD